MDKSSAGTDHATTITPMSEGSNVCTVRCICGWNGGDPKGGDPMMSRAEAERSASIHTR